MGAYALFATLPTVLAARKITFAVIAAMDIPFLIIRASITVVYQTVWHVLAGAVVCASII